MRDPIRFFGIAGLLFGACLTGGLGSLYLLDPGAVREAAGISPETPTALAEIRSTYGGLHVGIALFLLVCAAREGWRRIGLLLCGLAFAGAGLARFAGIAQFDVDEPAQIVVAALELVYSGITLFLFRRWPRSLAPRP